MEGASQQYAVRNGMRRSLLKVLSAGNYMIENTSENELFEGLIDSSGGSYGPNIIKGYSTALMTQYQLELPNMPRKGTG